MGDLRAYEHINGARFDDVRNGRLDVLLITSGDDVTEQALRAVLEADPGVDWMHVQRPGAEVFFTSRASGIWDAYLMHETIFEDGARQPSPDVMRGFAELCQVGHGFVVLHEGANAWPDWPAWREFVGGVPNAALAGDAALTATRGEPHPVLTGLNQPLHATRPVAVGGMGVRPLIVQGGKVLAWTHRVGQAEVVYLPVGATATSIVHPVSRLLIANALRWVSRERSGGPAIEFVPL